VWWLKRLKYSLVETKISFIFVSDNGHFAADEIKNRYLKNREVTRIDPSYGLQGTCYIIPIAGDEHETNSARE